MVTSGHLAINLLALQGFSGLPRFNVPYMFSKRGDLEGTENARVSRRYHLACYVTPEIFAAFGELARSRHMTVTGLLRRLVVAEIEASSLLDPGDLERNIVFLVRAVNALLAAQDPRLRDRVVAEWHREVFEEGGRDD